MRLSKVLKKPDLESFRIHGGLQIRVPRKFELAVQNGEGAGSPDVDKSINQTIKYVIIESI